VIFSLNIFENCKQSKKEKFVFISNYLLLTTKIKMVFKKKI